MRGVGADVIETSMFWEVEEQNLTSTLWSVVWLILCDRRLTVKEREVNTSFRGIIIGKKKKVLFITQRGLCYCGVSSSSWQGVCCSCVTGGSWERVEGCVEEGEGQ